MTKRENVLRADIDTWMTQALQKVDDCDGSTLKVPYLLQQLDEGCNWSEGLLSVVSIGARCGTRRHHAAGPFMRRSAAIP